MVLLFIISGIEIFFLKESMDNTSSFVASILGASIYNILKFLEDNKRIPYKLEKIKLIWSALFVIWFHLLISFVTNYNTIKIDYLLSFFMLIIISSILYITLNFIYGYFAKFQYNSMKKRGLI
jgi:hypothetical protein